MIGVAAAVGVMAFGVGVGQPISPVAFGQHVATIAQAPPRGLDATSIRLWDTGTRWDQIEVAPNRYNWTTLDAAVANARKAGAKDILYVLGSTPQWAARNPNLPGLYGRGTTSLPRDPGDYVGFVKTVAKRYKGQITGYQIWNEANTRSFYEGDWTKLAKLTRQAHDAIKAVDRKALVVGASSTVIPGPLFQNESFFVRYARALHKQGDPVDAMAVHLYPVDTSTGPDARARSIRAAQRVLNRVGIDRPLWDTEVNYGDQRPGLPRVVPDDRTAATYVARTYLDSATLGIARTYWYGWDLDVLGVELTDGSGLTPAGRAFSAVQEWLTKARPAGCVTAGGLRQCGFTSAKASPFTVVWATGRAIRVDSGGRDVCLLDGSCKARPSVQVDSQPVLLRAR